MDDNHACLKKDYVQEFHNHLNSGNPHIQFTKEAGKDNRLSFLDTTTTRVRGRIQVSVYRKPTHTDHEKHLDYNSHHPSQHKRSLVDTLLHRAQDNLRLPRVILPARCVDVFVNDETACKAA